ncbi:hypothetical protein QT998_01115 [Microcoleus sp. S1D4]
MVELNWRDCVVMISFMASIAGLLLLGNKRESKLAGDRALSEEMLIEMSFTYWIVYCISVFGLKLHLPEDSWLLLSLKLTTVLSYLLTASSILSLPLQRMAVRRVED